MIYRPHDYQRRAHDFVVDTPYCALWMEMGLGKTVTVLTAINTILYDLFEPVNKILVVAPLRVARATWSAEIEKWDHTRPLTYTKVLGDARAREKALKSPARIHIINRENIPWLVEFFRQRKAWPYTMVVLDESRSFHSASSERFKAMRKVRKFIRRMVQLTGTPAPQGLHDLWGQVFLLDEGQRFGTSYSTFLDNYFYEDRYKVAPRDGTKAMVFGKVKDVALTLRTADYLNMPPLQTIPVPVELDDAARDAYEELRQELIVELDGEVINAANAAVLAGKLLQATSGAIYTQAPDGTGPKTVVHLHDAKIEAVKEVIDQAEGPVLVAYWYQHEIDRLKKAIPGAVVLDAKNADVIIARWNRGEIPVLLAHPQSAGHGLNLQGGGNTIIWFTLPWSLELYQQFVARLHRQGQTKPVFNYILCATDTVDQRVQQALASNAKVQDALLDAVKVELTSRRPQPCF